MALPARELVILKEFHDLHIALWSRDNELNYLRLVADLLVEKLVDDTRIGGRAADFEMPLNSHGVRILFEKDHLFFIETVAMP